jgi:hypothetical protein
MLDRPFRAFGVAALPIAAALAILAIAPASAKAPSSITFHFFSKPTSFVITDASGKPIAANSVPAPGDIVEVTDLNYLGNHKHHARHWTATDHLRCVFTTVSATGGQGICDGQIAIGGSMLLADHVVGTLAPTSTSVPINGGTGVYRGYHGTTTTKSIPHTNNSDFTIKVSR